MEWLAHLDSGSSVSSNTMDLCVLLNSFDQQIVAFYWHDDSGMRLGCKIPPGCVVVAFKRNYVSTDGTKVSVFVVGWRPVNLQGAGSGIYAFLQPDGLVEVSHDREYVTALELRLTEGR